MTPPSTPAGPRLRTRLSRARTQSIRKELIGISIFTYLRRAFLLSLSVVGIPMLLYETHGPKFGREETSTPLAWPGAQPGCRARATRTVPVSSRAWKLIPVQDLQADVVVSAQANLQVCIQTYQLPSSAQVRVGVHTELRRVDSRARPRHQQC
jgi:hypothetical protein